MDFDWDPVKALTNFQKHGISFFQASDVFSDPQHIVEDVTRPEYGERRMMAIGRVEVLMISVIFTDRDGIRRIISARRARRSERERYRQSAEAG